MMISQRFCFTCGEHTRRGNCVFSVLSHRSSVYSKNIWILMKVGDLTQRMCRIDKQLLFACKRKERTKVSPQKKKCFFSAAYRIEKQIDRFESVFMCIKTSLFTFRLDFRGIVCLKQRSQNWIDAHFCHVTDQIKQNGAVLTNASHPFWHYCASI